MPLVILVCGTACVGKSTIATQLAQRLNLPNVLQVYSCLSQPLCTLTVFEMCSIASDVFLRVADRYGVRIAADINRVCNELSCVPPISCFAFFISTIMMKVVINENSWLNGGRCWPT